MGDCTLARVLRLENDACLAHIQNASCAVTAALPKTNVEEDVAGDREQFSLGAY